MSASSLIQAYVLHARPYQNSSLLLDLFSLEHGIISAVARGAKRPKSPWRGILQPFIPLYVEVRGKSNLQTLTKAETVATANMLQGRRLFLGFYLNELLLRLLAKQDPHPKIFSAYQAALHNLNENHCEQTPLRIFELALLQELGFGMHFEMDVAGELIKNEGYYRYIPAQGFELLPDEIAHRGSVFTGQELNCIASAAFDNETVLQKAKYLMRLAFLPLLENRPLRSREVFL